MLYTYDTLTLMLGVMGLGTAIFLAFRLLDVFEKRRHATFVTNRRHISHLHPPIAAPGRLARSASLVCPELVRDSLTKPFGLPQDQIHVRCSHKGLGISVPPVQVGEHGFLHF
jgi:hypothetical protein